MTLYGKGGWIWGKGSSLKQFARCDVCRRIAVGNVDVPFVFIRRWLLRREGDLSGSQPSGGLVELEIDTSRLPNKETLT